mmetsp:Transcript_32335/g.31739  ORF Transcript_32335/g.31739 Transcript_32335/m.31739 type:complete len:181 (+) Transcript_32335:97-639(+)
MQEIMLNQREDLKMIQKGGTLNAICEINSYLSYPALYTHKKTKHPDSEGNPPKVVPAASKRGRPPKSEKYGSFSEKYSDHDGGKSQKPQIDLLKSYQDALKEFTDQSASEEGGPSSSPGLMKSMSKLFKNQIEPQTNPLYKCLEKVTAGSKEKIKNCDEAMAEYLNYCTNECNSEFFLTV